MCEGMNYIDFLSFTEMKKGRFELLCDANVFPMGENIDNILFQLNKVASANGLPTKNSIHIELNEKVITKSFHMFGRTFSYSEEIVEPDVYIKFETDLSKEDYEKWFFIAAGARASCKVKRSRN